MTTIQDIQYTKLIVVDYSGIRRSRCIVSHDGIDEPKSIVSKYPKVGMVLASFGDLIPNGSPFTATEELRIFPIGQPMTMPWDTETRIVLGDFYTSSNALWEGSPRFLLQKAIANMEQTTNTTIHCGFEVEFQLFKRNSDGKDEWFDTHQYCRSDSMTNGMQILKTMVSHLAKLGIKVLEFHPESACGQFEIILQHFPALEAADKIILTKETICAVAQTFGFKVCFLPKSIANQAGNGMHCHISIHDKVTGSNITGGNGKYALGNEASHFIAGLIHYLPALLALTTPSSMSFERTKAHCWAGAYQCWGIDNKEVPIRLQTPPSGCNLDDLLHHVPGQDPKHTSTNFEVKCFDATANPYLAIAGIVVVGLQGMKEKLQLPHPVQVDPATISGNNAPVALPASLNVAIEEFKCCKLLVDFFGETIVDALTATRLAEYNALDGKDFESKVELLKIRY